MSNFYDLKIYSQLASASYGGKEIISSEYTKIDDKAIAGFYAAIYENKVTHKKVLTMKGYKSIS